MTAGRVTRAQALMKLALATFARNPKEEIPLPAVQRVAGTSTMLAYETGAARGRR